MKDQTQRGRPAWPCPSCGGAFPGDEIDDSRVCRCGQTGWGAPFPWPKLTGAEWEHLTILLTTRSNGLCEGRTPACLAAGNSGRLVGVTSSRHHRKKKQSGGTVDPVVHSLANLLLLCGDGTTGCHGWAHHNHALAAARGLIVEHGVGPGCDPAQVPLITPAGRRYLLDPVNPFYLDPPNGARNAAC